MRLSVMIEGQEGVSWPDWAAIAAACEEHGVDELFRSDHYLPLDGFPEREALDAWATVSALAATTSRLRLGTLVSPATFRHPSNLAKLYASADEISGGRVSLGLGAGWHEREHAAFGFPFGPVGERFDVFAEQIEIVRGLWGPGPFSFAGEHYSLDAVDARPKPANPWLIVGGSAGPRSLALAARFADEYNTVFATVDECRRRHARWQAAWSGAGRSEPPRFSLMTGILVGRDAAEVEDRRRLLAERRAEPSFQPAPPWLHGTVEEVLAQLAELETAGVDRVMCQLLLHDDLDQIELVGRALQT
jgi:alkanesulfonate monooxygenase SsuD/methylene tetrahydromethanopterin reductase-like flavin-dependent oxidoreductase (luciferase family)